MDYKELLRQKRLPDGLLKRLIEDGTLNGDELLRENLISQAKYDQLFYVPPEEHLKKIGEYSDHKIKSLIEGGTLQESDLAGMFSQNELDRIMRRPKEPIRVEWPDDIPDLMPDRVDVFVLGIATSGKSTFMSGLIYYVNKIGRLRKLINNRSGAMYTEKLISAVQQGKLPPATPVGNIQFMACDFRDQSNVEHPLSFVEMSGEIFEDSFGKTVETLPGRFKKFLFSENFKIFFFAVDYHIHDGRARSLEYSQSAQFEFIMEFLAENGTLEHTDAVCILITKWDLSPDQSQDAAEQFLREHYRNLVNLCDLFSKRYNFEVKIFTYSLGQFDDIGNYTYNPEYSERIYRWICSFARQNKKDNKPGWRSWFR